MKRYRKKGTQPMIPWEPNMATNSLVSISEADRVGGSPRVGDMIAISADDPTDMWLVAEKFFLDNYEEA